MRTVSFIGCVFLASALFSTHGVSQEASRLDGAENRNVVATNECFAKGGIGIVNMNLYVDLKSAKNELVLSAGKRWSGHTAPTPEVVIFFDGRVWPHQDLPDGFDLSKAVVVSFEGSKVRFFDFGKMSGGYYRKPRAEFGARQPQP